MGMNICIVDSNNIEVDESVWYSGRCLYDNILDSIKNKVEKDLLYPIEPRSDFPPHRPKDIEQFKKLCRDQECYKNEDWVQERWETLFSLLEQGYWVDTSY